MNDSQVNSTVDDQHSNNYIDAESGGFITKATGDLIRSVISFYLLPPVYLFGLIGNVLSLIIFCWKKMRQCSTNVVLAYLALIDTLFLLISFMRKMSWLIGKADPLTAQTSDNAILTVPVVLELMTNRISSFLSLVICCERFIAVFKPLKVKFWVTSKRIVFALVAVTAFVFGILAVGFGMTTFRKYYDDTKNRTMARLTYKPSNLNNPKNLNAYSVFITVSLRLLPMFPITILTIAIIAKMHQRKKWLKHVTNATQNANAEDDLQTMTKILMTTVSIYIACNLFGNSFLVLSWIDSRFSIRGEFSIEFRTADFIISFFDVCNSSANFVVYTVMNKKFSSILVQMLRDFRKKIRSDTRYR
ncbi:hypothetical protein SNE40_010660 [Patella caerulea]